jgi:hypothetical protein
VFLANNFSAGDTAYSKENKTEGLPKDFKRTGELFRNL